MTNLEHCDDRTCFNIRAAGPGFCSISCALEDTYDSGASGRVGRVRDWDEVEIGSRIRAVIGKESVVGLYFLKDGPMPNGEIVLPHRVTSDAFGDVQLGDVDELYVEVPAYRG